MKKLLLLMSMAVLAAAGFSTEASVKITVDHAQNITMTGSAGYGSTVTLQDNLNEFAIEDLAENPYVFEGANGAEIERLEVDGTVQQVSMGTNNGYRIGVSDGMNINIVTKGGSVTTDVTVTFSADKVNTLRVLYDGNVEYNPTSITVAAGTTLRIEPMPGYSISLSYLNSHGAVDNGDGSYNFVANTDDTIWSASKVTGIDAVLNLDLAANASVSFGSGDAMYDLQMLIDGRNEIATDEAHMPLNIGAAAGSSILSVEQNGSAVNASGDGNWHIGIASGDVIDVRTQGPAQDVTFYNFGTADFGCYDITVGGDEIEAGPNAESVTVTGHIGDAIVVTPHIGTSIEYVSPGKEQPDGSWTVTLTKSNSNIYISGKRETAVTINVDSAARVSVKQLDGHDEALALNDGANKFDLANLVLPLSISATEGNRIESVMHNGTELKPKANGTYSVSPVEGSVISIASKVVPKAVDITFALGDNWDKLTATADGEPLEITSASFTQQFIPGTLLTLHPAKGYEIASVQADGNTVTGDKRGYTIEITDAGTITVSCDKMTAPEGYAIVTIDSNRTLLYEEYDAEGQWQRDLGTTEAYEVKIGSRIDVYTRTKAIFFKSVTVNGQPIEPNADNERKYSITVTGDAAIVADTYKKLSITTDRVINPDNYTVIGELYIKDGDDKTTSYYAEAGETIEFIPETARGFKLDCIKFVYPEGREDLQGYTYTVTEEDVENYELMVFKGSYSEASTVYYIEGNTTYGQIEGNTVKMGEVWPLNDEGESQLSVTACENDIIDFEVITEPGYAFTNLTLFRDPEKVLDRPYTVNPDDADSQNLISIAGIFAINGSVTYTGADDSGLEYHKATRELVSAQPITVYDLDGTAVGYSAEGTIDLSGYAAGIYIAVSGNRAIKFAL